MAAFSQYMEQQLLNWAKGAAIDAAPTGLELALHTANPLDDYSGAAEVTAGGYSRQVITLGSLSSVVSIGTTVKNSGVIVFGPATASWGSITHWSIHGTGANTNFLYFGAFLAAKAIISGDSYVISDETLEILVR
jgi:hypothetical protein